MTQPYLALITPLTGHHPDQGLPGAQPGYPSQGLPPFATQLPIIIPGAPPGSPGSPSHPIYLPVYPSQGLPGHQPHPDQGLPGGQGGRPTHPIHIPGVPDQGLPPGQNIPSNELPPIPVPPEYQDDLVIGVKPAGSTEWKFTAYDTSLTPGYPLPPTPEPK